MARKLKGKNVESLKKEQKEKMEKTLKRMDKTREKDNTVLRDKINKAVESYEKEIKNADNTIKILEKQIRQNKDVKLRLEGAIYSLRKILNNDSESKS